MFGWGGSDFTGYCLGFPLGGLTSNGVAKQLARAVAQGSFRIEVLRFKGVVTV